MKVIVVGSGAGGSTAARELAMRGADVLVVEAGAKPKPFTRRAPKLDGLRHTGLLNPRTLPRVVAGLGIERLGSELLAVRGVAEGGSTVISCGNWVRADRGLADIGLDLSAEFDELERLLRPVPFPRERWRPVSERLFLAAEKMGLEPRPTPKVLHAGRCRACGLCELGCATGARWDARGFLSDAVRAGARVRLETKVRRILLDQTRVCGIEVGSRQEKLQADVVVLAAGGIGTAQILAASGLGASDRLWIDVVLTVGGRAAGARQLSEPPMVWFARRDDYILSPYVDLLSHFMHRPWRGVALRDRVGMMVKFADQPNGSVHENGRLRKELARSDLARLAEASDVARDLLCRAGIDGPYVDGILHGGHLGGTVALRRQDVPSMRPADLPRNLWIADLSLLPESQGLPTMETTAALALRVARRLAAEYSG